MLKSKMAKMKDVSKMRELATTASPTQLCNLNHLAPALLLGQETAERNVFHGRELQAVCCKCEVATSTTFPKATAFKTLGNKVLRPKPTKSRREMTNAALGSAHRFVYVGGSVPERETCSNGRTRDAALYNYNY